MNENTVLFG